MHPVTTAVLLFYKGGDVRLYLLGTQAVLKQKFCRPYMAGFTVAKVTSGKSSYTSAHITKVHDARQETPTPRLLT